MTTFTRHLRPLIIALALAACPVFAADDSPITSNPFSSDNTPAAVADATKRGATAAAKDISAGTLRILYFGKPWSQGKPLVDEATGYRVQITGGCVVTAPFVAEVNAYNTAMREWHSKEKPASPSK